MATTDKSGNVSTNVSAPTDITISPAAQLLQIQVDDGGNHSQFRFVVNAEPVDIVKNSAAMANGGPVIVEGPVSRLQLYSEDGATGQTYAVSNVLRANTVGAAT